MAKGEPTRPPAVKAQTTRSKPASAITASKAKPKPATPELVTEMQPQTKQAPAKRVATAPMKKITADPDCNQGEMVSADLQATVGENLHAARLSASLTLQQVAAQAGMTFQYVSKVERGEKNMTLSTLNRLASVLRTDISALLRKTTA